MRGLGAIFAAILTGGAGIAAVVFLLPVLPKSFSWVSLILIPASLIGAILLAVKLYPKRHVKFFSAAARVLCFLEAL